jgi:SnoaL-like domain
MEEEPMTDIEDHAAMRRLADVYCSAVDDGDAERMAALFAPGGRLVVYRPGDWPGAGEPLRRWDGIEGFTRLLAVLEQAYVRWVHFLGNHWVEVDGDRASGEAYLFACHLRMRDDGAEEEEVAVIRYKDLYVRTPDGWRFEERNACRQWTTVRPLVAGTHEIDALLHPPG